MAIIKRPLNADGVVLSGPADPNSLGQISDTEVGIFTDENGNMLFRDKYVSQILGKETISLKELYTRVNGIFTELDSTGKSQLLFKDETVSRAYSLQEIVSSCSNWRKNLTNGSLWWVGRSEVDHSSCANLPRATEPDGTPLLWSVDRFLAELNNLSQCDSVNPVSFYDLTTDPRTGEPRWWDVQNLELVLPPTDAYKSSLIMAKLAYSSYNSPEPIMFRLYDATTGTELVRTAVVNDNSGKILYPAPLTYFGPLPSSNSKTGGLTRSFSSGFQQDCDEDCGCTNVNCIEGDPYCVTSSAENFEQIFQEGSHLIKVQFRVINYHPNHWERVFGLELPETGSSGQAEYLTSSCIDAVLFNTSPDSKYARQHGTAEFINSQEVVIEFAEPFISTDYSVTLACNQNINVWFSNKTRFGFTLKAELPFSGLVDWTVLSLGD